MTVPEIRDSASAGPIFHDIPAALKSSPHCDKAIPTLSTAYHQANARLRLPKVSQESLGHAIVIMLPSTDDHRLTPFLCFRNKIQRWIFL